MQFSGSVIYYWLKLSSEIIRFDDDGDDDDDGDGGDDDGDDDDDDDDEDDVHVVVACISKHHRFLPHLSPIDKSK